MCFNLLVDPSPPNQVRLRRVFCAPENSKHTTSNAKASSLQPTKIHQSVNALYTWRSTRQTGLEFLKHQTLELTLDAIRMPGKGPLTLRESCGNPTFGAFCAATHSRVCFKIEARCISAPSPPLARMLRSLNPQTQLPTPKPEGPKSKSPTHKRLPPTKTHKHYIDFL